MVISTIPQNMLSWPFAIREGKHHSHLFAFPGIYSRPYGLLYQNLRKTQHANSDSDPLWKNIRIRATSLFGIDGGWALENKRDLTRSGTWMTRLVLSRQVPSYSALTSSSALISFRWMYPVSDVFTAVSISPSRPGTIYGQSSYATDGTGSFTV